MLHGFVFSGSGKSAVGFGPSRDKSHFSVGQRLASAWDLIFYARSCHFIPIAALAARAGEAPRGDDSSCTEVGTACFF